MIITESRRFSLERVVSPIAGFKEFNLLFVQLHSHTVAQSLPAEDEMPFRDVGAEVEVASSDTPSSDVDKSDKFHDKNIQCILSLRAVLTVDCFCEQPRAIKFYTSYKFDF